MCLLMGIALTKFNYEMTRIKTVGISRSVGSNLDHQVIVELHRNGLYF